MNETRNNQQNSWEQFEHSGKISDYLRYRGQLGVSGGAPENREGEGHADDGRRTGHPGKDAQQR